ncbi:MAG: hypothetical protein ABJH28_06415 [Paraglaciecola sp.]|uniref:hypothetical protein n=1 Tax=Paraglaciecola sp. TaxID=1920173 RepID=UPI0032647242
MTSILKNTYEKGLDDTILRNLSENFNSLGELELKVLVADVKSLTNTFASFETEFLQQYEKLSKLEKIDRDILRVLNLDDYQARTIKGLSKDVDKSENEIVERITYSKYLNEFLKVFPRKSRSGEVLITTKSKYEKSATYRDKFIDAFATSRVRLK